MAVPGGIGDRFLDDAAQRQHVLFAERIGAAFDGSRDGDVVDAAETVGDLLQGAHGAETEPRRREPVADVAHFLHGGEGGFLRGGKVSADAFAVDLGPAQAALCQLNALDQGRHSLQRAVVDLAGEAGALFFLGAHDVADVVLL